MNDSQLARLGEDIVDACDNYLEYETMPLPDSMRVAALLNALKGIRSVAHELYVELSGDDPWQKLAVTNPKEDTP